MKLEKGLVHIYTGEGKGKTTSALGLALRAIKSGLKVYLIQFMKGDTEEKTVKQLNLTNFQYFGHKRNPGKWKWVYKGKVGEEDKQIAAEGLRFAEQTITEGKYDVVILDEVIIAVWFGLLKEEDLLNLIKKKPVNVELILTGRRASQKLIGVADYVSDVTKVKHPYDKGIIAREGIDY